MKSLREKSIHLLPLALDTASKDPKICGSKVVFRGLPTRSFTPVSLISGTMRSSYKQFVLFTVISFNSCPKMNFQVRISFTQEEKTVQLIMTQSAIGCGFQENSFLVL